jgi:hypothetical protein
MAKKTAKTNGHLKFYGSYSFKDKEPVIDMTRTLFEDVYGEKINNKMLRAIERQGGPSVSCMRAWFFGKTCRPSNVTVEASGRALGFERVWRKMSTKAAKG